MMLQDDTHQPKTIKEKLSEPILNAKQIFAIMITLLYEVVSNIMIYSLMEDPSWVFISVNIGIGIIIIVCMALLRAAFPEEIPDKTIWSAFWVIWTQVVDMITDKTVQPEIKMESFEKAIQWIVREWDIAYQEKLSAQIEYYRSKLNEQIEAIEDKLKI